MRAGLGDTEDTVCRALDKKREGNSTKVQKGSSSAGDPGSSVGEELRGGAGRWML